MRVPPECIVVTSMQDARTAVSYAPLSETSGAYERQRYSDIAREGACKLRSLDSLIRYPYMMANIHPSSSDQHTEYDDFHNEMNEVAFLSCAKGMSGEIYIPQVVGVFIDRSAINSLYIDAGREYATSAGLPIIGIYEIRAGFSQPLAHEIITGWFEASKSFNADIMNYQTYRPLGNGFDQYLTEDQQAILEEGLRRVRAILTMHEVECGIDGAPIYSTEAIARAFAKFFQEFPKYREVKDLQNFLTIKDQKYQMSQEQLAGYGLH